MIYLLITIIALFIINIGLGNLYQKILGSKHDNVSMDTLYGVIITAIIWTILSFFTPINSYLELSFSAIGFYCFFHFKSYLYFKNFLKDRGAFFYLLVGIIILGGSFAPFIYDHFGYYVPTIKWLKEFKLINGISNLDLNLGQASVWHIYQTGFSNFIDPFLRINTFLLVLYVIYSFESKRWILLTFTPILLLFTQSPSPDLVVFCLALIVLNELLNYPKNAQFLFVLSVFTFIIKPTMLWLPMFCGLYFFWLKNRSLKFSIPGLAILCLYMVKNLWLFGYPFFPMSILDFNFPWKPNSGLMQISADVGLLKTFDFQYPVEQIKQFSTIDYLKNWLTLDGIKSKMNWLLILTLFGFALFCIIKKRKIYSLLFATLLIKSAIVIGLSGQYRFFIDVILIVIFILLYKTWYAFSKLTTLGLAFIVILVLSLPNIIKSELPSFKAGQLFLGFTPQQIIKPTYFELDQYSSHKIGNLTFNVVRNYPFSFDTPFPAIQPDHLKYYLHLGIFPQLKTSQIKEGFVWKKLTNSEKMQLERIIMQK